MIRNILFCAVDRQGAKNARVIGDRDVRVGFLKRGREIGEIHAAHVLQSGGQVDRFPGIDMIVVVAARVVDGFLDETNEWYCTSVIQRDIVGEDLRLFCRTSARVSRRVKEGNLDFLDQQGVHTRQVAEFGSYAERISVP